MKIIKICFAIAIVVLIQQGAISQTLKSSTLKNVININNNDVISNGNIFLIDIPIPVTDSVITILNNSNIPNKLFFDRTTFMPLQKEILLIAPDKEYYKAVASQHNVYCAEPITTNKYYRIKRNNNVFTVDSTTIQGVQPDLKFKDTKPKNNSIIYYFKDSYGSACCPRDPRRDLQEQLASPTSPNLKKFKERWGSKDLGIHNVVTGKEGEHEVYYTLPGFTLTEKLDFIIDMQHLSRIQPNKSKHSIYLADILIR